MKKKTLALMLGAVGVLGMAAWYYTDPRLPTKMLAWLGKQDAAREMARQAMGSMDAEGYAYWMGFVEMPTPETIHLYDEETQKVFRLGWEATGVISPTGLRN
jgi:hypothetical protein